MKKTINRVLALVTSVLLVLSIAACGDKNDTSSEVSDASGSKDSEQKTNSVNFNKTIDEISAQKRGEWGRRADSAYSFMRKDFFGESDLYNNTYPLNSRNQRDFHYWIQAQMLDNVVDAYIRTGDKEYAQNAKDLIEAIRVRNGRFLITNDFYDDMGWLANAMVKLYAVTGDEDLWPDIMVLKDDIFSSWNDSYGGGIPWMKSQLDYKNSPANGPACIFAARLYQVTGEQEYLDMALKIFEWWDNTLVDHETGLIWDGINRQGDGAIDKGWRFTYCQGVYIGSCVELYNITKDGKYIDKAVKTADYATNKLLGHGGVLQDEGDGDGGAFKGIFVRYLTQLIKTTSVNREIYCDFLSFNGEKLWSNIPSEEKPIFNKLWSIPAGNTTSLQIQTSGLALLESLADLYINGYIENPQ